MLAFVDLMDCSVQSLKLYGGCCVSWQGLRKEDIPPIRIDGTGNELMSMMEWTGLQRVYLL
jgi:hypothetical protein